MKIRHVEDIQTLGDIMTLLPRAERQGRFRCGTKLPQKDGSFRLCLKDHSSTLKPLPNDGENYSFVCTGCGQRKRVNTGELATQMIIKNRNDQS